jgi:hypothetical protein
MSRHYLAIGTAVLGPDSDPGLYGEGLVTAKEGKMYLFEPFKNDNGWDLRLVTLMKTIGPVYDIEVIHGFLTVAAGSKVIR